ncbi:prepilin peptidase [Shimazuella kribbensis]|uniref:prepilin peptidase n=1 Tax=Shimazuella kribbensis TaxID=139808 RepID=UPI0003FB3657|nr:A24 family peptidase [Shimazuella kribbensis]
MEISLSLIIALSCGLVGLFLPFLGKKLLHYRGIVSPSADRSVFLGILAAIGGVSIVLQIEEPSQLILSFLFLFLLQLIGWIDWHTGYILDQLTFGGSILIVGIQLIFNPSMVPIHLAVSASLYLFLYAVAKGTNRLGLGDAKLVAMCALIMEWQDILCALWLSSISGLLYVGILVIQKKMISRSYSLPFGPHLAIGFFLSYLFGENIACLFSLDLFYQLY